MPNSEPIAFAGTVVEIDGVPVSKLTKFELNYDISEEQISGSEDTVGTAPNKVTLEDYIPVAVGKKASLEGIAINADQGQQDLEDAAGTGKIVSLRQYDQDGQGAVMTGFFLNWKKTGSLPGKYTWTSEFRIKTANPVNGSAS